MLLLKCVCESWYEVLLVFIRFFCVFNWWFRVLCWVSVFEIFWKVVWMVFLYWVMLMLWLMVVIFRLVWLVLLLKIGKEICGMKFYDFELFLNRLVSCVLVVFVLVVRLMLG